MNVNGVGTHEVRGVEASQEVYTVETRPDGSFTLSSPGPLFVDANQIPAIRVEDMTLEGGVRRDRFFLAEDGYVDFLIDAAGEVSFSGRNVAVTVTRSGVVTFGLKG